MCPCTSHTTMCALPIEIYGIGQVKSLALVSSIDCEFTPLLDMQSSAILPYLYSSVVGISQSSVAGGVKLTSVGNMRQVIACTLLYKITAGTCQLLWLLPSSAPLCDIAAGVSQSTSCHQVLFCMFFVTDSFNSFPQ
jgi:hypothetical protein